MPELHIFLTGDNAWPDLKDRMEDVVHLKDGDYLGIAVLDRGMRSGRASVMLRFDLPDGKVVMAETSLRLLTMAAQAFNAKHPDPDGPMPPADAPPPRVERAAATVDSTADEIIAGLRDAAKATDVVAIGTPYLVKVLDEIDRLRKGGGGGR